MRVTRPDVGAELAGRPKLRENGLAVRIDRTENLGAEKSVVLAIDRSQSMRGAPLAHAIAAARSFVASKPASDRVAVASFATRPQLLTDFSTERSDSDGALRSIQVDPVQGTTLYDAVVKRANVLATEPLEARVMIVVTDGNETRSSASLDDAIAAARKAGASIYVVAIESPKFNPAPLHKLAEETGGAYHGTSSSATLSCRVRGDRGRAQAARGCSTTRPRRGPGTPRSSRRRGRARSRFRSRSRCRRASAPARTTRSRRTCSPTSSTRPSSARR